MYIANIAEPGFIWLRVCVCKGATLLSDACLGGSSLKVYHWERAVSTIVL